MLLYTRPVLRRSKTGLKKEEEWIIKLMYPVRKT